LIINSEPLEKRVALLVDGRLEKFEIERESDNRMVGGIYKGRIKNLDPGLKAAYVKNADATLPSLRTLGACNPCDDQKTASMMLERIVPSVVQLVRNADGYNVKTANCSDKTDHRVELP